MIVFITLLLLAEGARQQVSCLSIGLNEDAELNDNAWMDHQREDNSILDELPGRGTRPSSLRSKRYLEWSPRSTEASTRVNYERAINQTVSDYYAQRKAVMDRYYARQREIVEKFSQRASPRRTFNDPTKLSISGDHTAITKDSTIENRTATNEKDDRKISNERETNQLENNNSSVSWIYRSSNWNPKEADNASDIDLLSESSNILEKIVRSAKFAGYYKLGEFKRSKDEKVVYQHNLGVGLKGSSQLDATFEVVLEGLFAITVVEAYPYASTRANLSWVSGGPGLDYVKLKLQGYENEGFSYTVKVWGVPKEI